ncbi:MAG TPA: dTDP-4-dehydrorhamnose reductase, partial [Anaerolineales bacterium]|nr:dTDP-4-dehydrorhamnose reductase [Anaerolineales bacterium]
MKILLFGKTGQLGWELERTLAALGKVHALGQNELDLQDLTALKKVIHTTKPDVIVNASAYTAVDRAEQEKEIAMRVNAEAPGVMAQAAKELRSVFVHYSTDYVFDGHKTTPYEENDKVNPLNVYGQSKLNGEQAVAEARGAHVILRTSWVYSLRGDGFVSKVLRWARHQETLKIVSDQVGSPTWARALAETTALMLAGSAPNPFDYFSERSGVYHLGGLGAVSRLDFAQEILRLDPHKKEQICQRLEPALTADFPTPALRPLTTPLNCSRFSTTFGVNLPTWQGALRLAI